MSNESSQVLCDECMLSDAEYQVTVGDEVVVRYCEPCAKHAEKILRRELPPHLQPKNGWLSGNKDP